jgi:hypothetical protein
VRVFDGVTGNADTEDGSESFDDRKRGVPGLAAFVRDCGREDGRLVRSTGGRVNKNRFFSR